MTADESAARRQTASENSSAAGDSIQAVAFTPIDQTDQRRAITVRPWQIGLGSALLIAALVIWYLFSAKAVVIDTQPAEASITISGGLQFKLSNHYLLRPGAYELSISADGYYPITTELTVNAEQNQARQFTLAPLPGHLNIHTQADVLAEVIVDGEPAGDTGSTINNIPAGEHQLELIAARYLPYSQIITINGRDTTQTLDVTLAPAWADISVTSTPAGASLYNGEELLGRTPITVQLLQGEHQLRVHANGYKSWNKTVTISAGSAQTFADITLEKVDGLVRLNSSPSGASVTVNGTFQGTTPLELALSPKRTHELFLFKDGYQPASKTVQTNSGSETNVTIALDVIVGSVEIQSTPKDALLYVDGRLMGRTGQTLTLPAHAHKLTIRQDGYVDYVTQVTPRPGLRQQVVARLRTEDEAQWDSVKPIIQTALNQPLKLFRPDVTFTMGSSRREQGRRANETLREVKLDRAFYIGQYEVTNAEFRRFDKFHSSGHVKGNSLNSEQNPVININWELAARFCNWLSDQDGLPHFYTEEKGRITGFDNNSTGYRMPTEAEWAWLARYENGAMKKYSWGEQLPIDKKILNIADRKSAPLLGYIQADYDDGFPVTAPIGSFPADNNGLYDLSGNVAEWLTDFYGVGTGLSLQLETNPTGPASGDYHVIRGSSWAHGTVTDLRLSFRDYGADKRYDVGFRIARYVHPQPDAKNTEQ